MGLSKEQLLADEALLSEVLAYHVVPGRVNRADFRIGKAVMAQQGGFFLVDDAAVDDRLLIKDGRNRQAVILQADLAAGNGVIHVLGGVLLPGNRTLLQTIAGEPVFSILAEALEAANLQGTLAGNGPHTLVAPNNGAFTALFEELGITKDQFLANQALLSSVLSYHQVDDLLLLADLQLIDEPTTTVQGQTFQVSGATVGLTLAISDQRNRRSQVIDVNLLARDGAIHTVDRVLLPSP